MIAGEIPQSLVVGSAMWKVRKSGLQLQFITNDTIMRNKHACSCMSVCSSPSTTLIRSSASSSAVWFCFPISFVVVKL